MEANGPSKSHAQLKSYWKRTRTGISELLMNLALYIGFYGCVALLLAVMFYVFLHHRKGAGDHSETNAILRGTPGMRFFPLPPGDNYNIFTIWYNRSTPQHTRIYTESLLRLVNKEYEKRRDVEYVHCDHNVTYQDGAVMSNLSSQGKFCKVYDHKYLNWGTVCTPYGNGTSIQNVTGPFDLGEDAFGFKNGTPCVMVRLNRISFWKPSSRPLTVEKKGKYRKIGVTFRPDWELKVSEFPNYGAYIWVYCDGLTEEDKEHIGPIQYFPSDRPAIPKVHFPFGSQVNYLAPFIFIQFLNPTLRTIIRVQCMAFDNNMNLDQHLLSHVGTINFELLID